MKRIASFLALCGLSAFPALAQFSHFTGWVGGGFTEPVKDIGTRLDMGWNAGGGIGINFERHTGILVDFMFNDLSINNATLNAIQVPNGTNRVWGFTLDPIFHITPRGEDSPVGLYVTGGGGIYHRTVEFTQPALATVPGFDPFFGTFFPATIATNQVLASYSQYKGGLDVGAGLDFKVGGHAKLFAEARYHYIFTAPTRTTLVPVTFGIRW